MKQQPDKIFREKLAQYSRPAPEMAWERIERGLSKKPFAYWKVSAAAAILVLTGIGYFFLRNDMVTAQTQIAERRIPAESEKVPSNTNGPEIMQKEENMEKKIQADQIRAMEPPQHSDKAVTASTNGLGKDSKTSLKQKSLPSRPEIDERDTPERGFATDASGVSNELTPSTISITATDHSQPENEVLVESPVVYVDAAKENIVLVLTSSDTDEYLIKNDDTDATSGGKMSSTLKRMLKKASELKTNQDPFGDLRQMKNEILALNFRSDKQREQKK